MRTRYRLFLLIGMALALAWLVGGSSSAPEIVSVTERRSLSGNRMDEGHSRHPLPHQLDRPMLSAAERDPFSVVLPPAPPPEKKVTPPPPPPPQPPALNLRFAGRISAPDGSQVIYVSFGDTSMPVSTGQVFPNGYRVEAIGPRAIELSYPPMNTTARLELPDPPKYETR